MEMWLFVLAAVSAVGSAVAALTSLAQARGTAEGNQVNAYLRLMEDYGAPAMREALVELGAFWRASKDKFADAGAAWTDLSASNPDRANAIRSLARPVSAFFGNAARLYEAGLISRKLLRLLISTPGLNVYYGIVAPINPKGDTTGYVRVLKSVVRQHADGLY